MRVLLGVTGASGSIYAERLLNILVKEIDRTYLVLTDAGKAVVNHELKPEDSLRRIASNQYNDSPEKLRIFNNDDLFSPVASGSSVPDAMVVLPSSMGTMSRIASGNSTNLLERSADVVLKEKKKLIIAPRETPLSTIHLRNMLSLSEMGAHIIPPMPAFYQQPKSIEDLVDFVVGRILEGIGLDHDLYRRWNSRLR